MGCISLNGVQVTQSTKNRNAVRVLWTLRVARNRWKMVAWEYILLSWWHLSSMLIFKYRPIGVWDNQLDKCRVLVKVLVTHWTLPRVTEPRKWPFPTTWISCYASLPWGLNQWQCCKLFQSDTCKHPVQPERNHTFKRATEKIIKSIESPVLLSSKRKADWSSKLCCFVFFRNYMNDSLRTNVFVRFQPETIACACIYLAARALQVSPACTQLCLPVLLLCFQGNSWK